jgi:hypothetical protein
MIDLDSGLREMFRARAADVTAVPAALYEFEATVPAGPRRTTVAGYLPARGARRRAYRSWLPVLAAAAAVAAVTVGIVVGVHLTRSHPPARPTPTIHTTPVPRPSPHAVRRVSLDWFGMKKLPGYALHMWQSAPGYRVLAVRRIGDPQQQIGCNGCESASDFIYVLDEGRFAAAQRVTGTWHHVSVSGRPGYVGTLREYGGGRYVVPTLAWQYRSGAWVLVQGVTHLGGLTHTLLTLAGAVEPTTSVPIRVPFTLGYVPALPIIGITDDRAEGNTLQVSFGSGSVTGATRSLDFTLWRNWPGVVHRSAATRRTIGGLTGYYADGVADVPVPGGVVEFGLTHGAGTTTGDLRDMQRIMAAIRWPNGDGSTPWPAAARAIP